MKLAQVAWAPGTQFSRYEIVSRLARGGMAEVWRAVVTGMAGFHREVVIKTMRPELAVSQDLVGMFINEARIAARLNHPGIMQVFDFGQLDSRYFIAMEYVPGRTLRQLARALRAAGRRIPRHFLLRLLTESARALGYGHTLTDGGVPLGFAHRDVSPENIMVSIDGTAKLIDFGAAVTRAYPPPPRTFIGKYRYLAPERLRGADGDARADVYSLGIVLYEYVTGRRPYDGPQIKNLILDGAAPDPCRLVPSLPRRLAGLITRAISVEPAKRFNNGCEFAEELASLLDRDLGDVPAAATEAEVFELLRADHVDGERAPGPMAEPPAEDSILAQMNLVAPTVATVSGAGGIGVAVVVSDPPEPDVEGELEVAFDATHLPAGAQAHREARGAEAAEATPSLHPDEATSREARDPVAHGHRPGSEVPVRSPDPGQTSGADPLAIVRRSLPELHFPAEWFGPSTVQPSVAAAGDAPALSDPTALPSVAAGAPSPASTDDSLLAEEDSASSCFERGLELVAKHQFEDAVALWRRATTLDPQRRSYRTNLERLEKRIATRAHAGPSPPRDPRGRS